LPDGVMRRMDMAYTEAKAYEKEYCVSASWRLAPLMRGFFLGLHKHYVV
jgi:hypothetical protein